MMMSYNSLVSGLQAKSILANIHASLVQHDGWLTKENCENYNLVLEDEKNAEWLAFEESKDKLYSEYKDLDAKLYMLISFGLYIVKDEIFQNQLRNYLPNLVFDEMKEFEWKNVSPKDFLDFWEMDKSAIRSFGLKRKLEHYKTDSAFVPFGESKLKGNVVKFVSDTESYIVESILSFLEFGMQNVILGEAGKEWNSVDGRSFDVVYLNCKHRMESILQDLNNAFSHLTDDGVVIVETHPHKDFDFRKYVVDHSMLEACFLGSTSTYIVRKEGASSKVYIEQVEYSNSYIGKKLHQNNISLSSLKDINYNMGASAIECFLGYGEKGMSMNKFLQPYVFTKHEDKEGYLFCYKNFANSYKSVIIQPTDLDIDKVEKCRKAISPVLIMSREKTDPHIVYVNASESMPVFIPYSYMVFSLDEDIVCPEYLYYLCQNGTWASAIKSCTDLFSGYAHSYIDPFGDVVDVTGEDIFLHECHIVPIPSLPFQRQKIEDARLLQKVMDDKNRAKEALFNQKEWLNETHIRNTKHRLSNDISPLSHSIQRLYDYMEKSAGHIHRDDVVSKKTGWTVGSLIENMLVSIKTIENTVLDFTNVRRYTDTSKICISEFLRNYCDNLSQKYFVPFTVETKGLDVCAKIEISRTALTDMLDNIVGNAVRHGFVKEGDNEYIISFEMEITNNGMCRLSISNNGKPMSERAKDIYFERGAFAGPTGHTGIGGAIVKGVCDQFNGNVFISENEKYPVVIVVEFPVLNY